MSNTITHHPQEQFEVRGNDLMVAGRSVADIKRRAGESGPVFIYDRGVIRNNVEQLSSALPNRIELSYAIKANPNPGVVAAVAEYVDGLDIASVAELKQAVALGIDPSHISFAGPGKRVEELRSAIEHDVVINVESKTELARCVELGEAAGKRPNVCLRVNPMMEVRSSGMKMSGAGSPFGIEAGQIPGILQDFPHDQLNFLGFHVFACSQILSADHLNAYYREVFKLLDSYRQYLAAPIKLLNLGGGFGIPYFPGETPLDTHYVGQELQRLISEYSDLLAEATLRMEFGRYIIGNAGLYVVEVTDIKNSGDNTFVVVNGGMHHHLANSGNLGQVVRRNYPVAVANKMSETPAQKVTIVGPLCTPLDIVAQQVLLPELAIGDLVAVFNSGAYALSASPVGFLSHPAPLEMLL